MRGIRTGGIVAAILLALLVVPVAAQQVDTSQAQSLREIRQRMTFALARAQNQRDEANAQIVHLQTAIAELTKRIAIEDTKPPVPPDTTPAPPPPDTTPTPPIEPPPPPPSGARYLFASDWSTATGSSYAAVMDGGRWKFASQQGTSTSGGWPDAGGKAVVSAAGLGFPTQNVFRVTASANNNWVQLRALNLPIPAVGESRYYRWYMRLEQPDNTSDNSNHPVEAANASPWAFEVENSPSERLASGKYSVWFLANDEALQNFDLSRAQLKQPHPNQAFIALDKGVTYRFEYAFHRTGSNTYRQQARVYSSAGVLLYDDDDFRSHNGVRMSSNPTLRGSANGLREWWFGLNGINGNGPFPFVFAYYAAACIRADDWCGPYRSGEGR